MPKKPVPIPLGTTFGRWTVIGDRKPFVRALLCRCTCGIERMVGLPNLTTGGSLSCGCFKNERTAQRFSKHGHSKTHADETPEYKTWLAMRARCRNPAAWNYDNYGGRGITICPEWDDFARFYADMGDKPGAEYSIDRRDNNGPYAAWNCRWATRKQQNNNRRKPRPKAVATVRL